MFTVTARIGPKVAKSKHGSLDEALAAIGEAMAGTGREGERQVLGRRYEPVRQVAGRFELRGPGGLRGGVDVRGDGSAEAFRGRIRKVVVPAEPGETALDALRRALQ